MAPGETLTTAHGLPDHALLPYGRDATSIAFLRPPGTPRLYSGVTNSTASDDAIFSLKSRLFGGGSCSKSWLKSGRSPISTISSSSGDGAIATSAFAIFRLNDSLRRLPTMTATWRVVGMANPPGAWHGTAW